MNYNLQILTKKMNIFNNNYNKYKSENCVDEIELYECLCDVMAWMEMCYKNNFNLHGTKAKMISAIRYANNARKHDISICNYHLSSTALCPSNNLHPSNNLFPSDFSINWAGLPLSSDDFIIQFNNYNSYLKDKDVYQTINFIYNIIKSYYK